MELYPPTAVSDRVCVAETTCGSYTGPAYTIDASNSPNTTEVTLAVNSSVITAGMVVTGTGIVGSVTVVSIDSYGIDLVLSSSLSESITSLSFASPEVPWTNNGYVSTEHATTTDTSVSGTACSAATFSEAPSSALLTYADQIARRQGAAAASAAAVLVAQEALCSCKLACGANSAATADVASFPEGKCACSDTFYSDFNTSAPTCTYDCAACSDCSTSGSGGYVKDDHNKPFQLGFESAACTPTSNTLCTALSMPCYWADYFDISRQLSLSTACPLACKNLASCGSVNRYSAYSEDKVCISDIVGLETGYCAGCTANDASAVNAIGAAAAGYNNAVESFSALYPGMGDG